MGRRIKIHPRIVEEIIPVLEPEEKARRIENFMDILCKVTKAEGYQGCKYDAETNTVIRYWD